MSSRAALLVATFFLCSASVHAEEPARQPNRFVRWLKDTRVVMFGVKNGSTQTYLDHNRQLGTGAALTVTEARSQDGKVRGLASPRQVAEVVTSGRGLRRYLNHVGKSTVELIFNPHSSEYGHMLIRAGKRIYDFGNVRQAGDEGFSFKVMGWEKAVGMVYQVPPESIPIIQKELGQLVAATRAFNLPPFDSYGNPVQLAPDGPGRYKIVSRTEAGKFRASGPVNATLVEENGKAYLQAPDGFRVPVLKQGKEGVVSVGTLTCTSFPMQTLTRLAVEGKTRDLGLGQLSEYAQKYAKTAVVKLVRGDTPAVPELLTVYTRRRGGLDVQQQVWDVGKSPDKSKDAPPTPAGDAPPVTAELQGLRGF